MCIPILVYSKDFKTVAVLQKFNSSFFFFFLLNTNAYEIFKNALEQKTCHLKTAF